MNYWGFDLGDGESAIARTGSSENAYPEIISVDGKKVTITVWAVMKNGEVRIGESAARSASAAVRSAARFKRRFLDAQSDSAALVRDFSARVFESLRGSGALTGGEKSNVVYIGCPAGWDQDARSRYQHIFETIGFPSPQVVSESRAVMVGAIQSNSVRDYVDLRSHSVLVIDIGSSTTDFAYIDKGKETEVHTGGEVALGGGIMDEVLLEASIKASPKSAALQTVLTESESWRVDCELHARRLKEKYYSLSPEERTPEECSESLLVTYDDPLILDLIMDESMSQRLTEEPCAQLGGKSFREVFCTGLRQVRESIGEAIPELLFLTGGVSRMDCIRTWCREIFPEAVIYVDQEPEFSVARGLSWCGKIDDELLHFRAEVDALIASNIVEEIVSRHLTALYKTSLEALIDPLLEHAVKPVLLEWQSGKIKRLSDLETLLQDKIRVYLYSENAKACLYQPVSDWLLQISDELEQYTSEICRRYHVPDRSLGISSGLTASDFHILEKIDAKDILSGDSLTWTAVFVESVISILIAMLCGGSGVVLISEGPVGMLIGFIISFLVLVISHIMGKKAIDEKLMNVNLPILVRKLALSNIMPKIELPRADLTGMLKQSKIGQAISGEENPDGKKNSSFHLLPKIRPANTGEISDRRMQAIRNRVMANYEKLIGSTESTELLALNARMSKDISEQIEKRLKELAEQVEIPLT